MKTTEFMTRRATPQDADSIATAHRDSIQSIGPRFYPATVVESWGACVSPDMYVTAMEHGEVFYIAVAAFEPGPACLGFASHRIDGTEHGTAVYVIGTAARRGVGSALFRLAEADALASGATSIHVDASLAAVDFYRANGFEEIGRGEHPLRSGSVMACVFMRKMLRTV
jgi:putative acetyltransferase